IAFADQRAQQIRNQGNQTAAEYYKTMSEAEDFAIFLVQLETLQRALGQYTTLVLPTNVAPFHLMNLMTPRSPEGVPIQPPAPTQPTMPPTLAPPTQSST